MYNDKNQDIFIYKNNKKCQKVKKKNEGETSITKNNEKERDRYCEKEMLKKIQEHRTKYEEPIPLPELTTDKIYVQSKNGFNAIKINDTDKQSRKNSEVTHTSIWDSCPIKIAIAFQTHWHSSGLIFQGLLGGITLFHFIFIKIYLDNYKNFPNYPLLLETYKSIFSFLIFMCIISIFDTYDLAHIREDYFRKIITQHLISALSVPLYTTVFFLHQITSKVDDKLLLFQYSSGNLTYYSNFILNDTNYYVDNEELKNWQTMTSCKNVFAILGWIFISIGIHKDMLLAYLEDMK